jgi:hypothetical protein
MVPLVSFSLLLRLVVLAGVRILRREYGFLGDASDFMKVADTDF